MRTVLINYPFFWIGLGVRVLLVAVFTPEAASSLFGPFLTTVASSPSLDPWDMWLSQGGDQEAFPYGYIALLVFLPLSWLELTLGGPFGIGYLTTLLLLDCVLLGLIARLWGDRPKAVKLYWLTPIVPVSTYVLGLNDLLPLLFLVGALVMVRASQPVLAGVFFAMAISAKVTALIALPFFLVFLLSRRNRKMSGRLLAALIASSIFLWLPTLLSPSAKTMLVQNPEWSTFFALSLELEGNLSILLLPLSLVFLTYQTWNLRRLNHELLFRLIGFGFLVFVLLSPASYGWFVLAVPLLAEYGGSRDRYAPYLVAIFSAQFVVTTFFAETEAWQRFRWTQPDILLELSSLPGLGSLSVIHTGLVALGLMLGLRAWKVLVREDKFTLLNQRPFAIGIAGDSASGKDTLADAITGVIGTESTVRISGDDYHLWDRHKSVWTRITHLNPAANDLEKFGRDLRDLSSGEAVRKRHYDHQTGTLSRPVVLEPNNFIIASGLHALYSPSTRKLLDIKVFLDTDERLRRRFKVWRDTQERGKSLRGTLSDIASRALDAQKFIQPQIAHSDLTLGLRPQGSFENIEAMKPTEVKQGLTIKSRNIPAGYALRRGLVSLAGLRVDLLHDIENDSIGLEVDGEVSGEDLLVLAQHLVPEVMRLLAAKPRFEAGMLGVMQLAMIQLMSDSLLERGTI